MTHPFHPLHGREFELIEIKPTMGVQLLPHVGPDARAGSCLDLGDWRPDRSLARHWYREAAMRGDDSAQFTLALK